MATIGIEIVDAALVAERDGARIASQPGVALLGNGSITTGAAAAAAQRLTPAIANDRFWSDLATESLARTERPQVSHADLAHAQLAALWAESAGPGDEAALALPATMRPQSVGLLVGIARHAGIPLAGLVDAAVAACAGLAARATVLHLDVQLHQAVLTEMGGESVLRRRRIATATRAGQRPMYAAWAQLVAEALVRRTRFDPLHEAATEQQLWLRLPEWLAALAGRESVDAVIDTDNGSFSAAVRREQFTLAAEAWYAQLSDLVEGLRRSGEPATLALSARAASLPALAERLGNAPGLDVAVLPDVAAAAGAAAQAAALAPAEPPALVLALPRAHPVEGGPVRRAVPVAATHVVQGGRAHAIDALPIVVGAGPGPGRRIALPGGSAGVSREHCSIHAVGGRAIVRDHSRHGTFVNGERVVGEAELGAGDRLRVGTPGIVLELVAVG